MKSTEIDRSILGDHFESNICQGTLDQIGPVCSQLMWLVLYCSRGRHILEVNIRE